MADSRTAVAASIVLTAAVPVQQPSGAAGALPWQNATAPETDTLVMAPSGRDHAYGEIPRSPPHSQEQRELKRFCARRTSTPPSYGCSDRPRRNRRGAFAEALVVVAEHAVAGRRVAWWRNVKRCVCDRCRACDAPGRTSRRGCVQVVSRAACFCARRPDGNTAAK